MMVEVWSDDPLTSEWRKVSVGVDLLRSAALKDARSVHAVASRWQNGEWVKGAEILVGWGFTFGLLFLLGRAALAKMRWIAERIAEQRLLWHLRKVDAASVGRTSGGSYPTPELIAKPAPWTV